MTKNVFQLESEKTSYEAPSMCVLNLISEAPFCTSGRAVSNDPEDYEYGGEL